MLFQSRRMFACIVTLLCLAVGALLWRATAPVHAISTGIVISQFYGGGGNTGAQYGNDYVELFNRGTVTVSLSNWSIQYTVPTGANLFDETVILLNGSLAPGQYYLVKLGNGGSNGVPLPAPDASADINVNAISGKVIVTNSTTGLHCNGSSTPCSAAQLAQIVDLIGYGDATFFEGSAAAPLLSNTTMALRSSGGCVDTDNNSADFSTGAPSPRNSTSALNTCAAPAITATPTATLTATATLTTTSTATPPPTSIATPSSTATTLPLVKNYRVYVPIISMSDE